jgi:hypothetical protein
LIDGVDETRLQMHNLKIAALAAAALLGPSRMIGAAAAQPLNGLQQVSNQVAADIQDVRLACGPHSWWHQPDHWWRGAGWHRPGVIARKDCAPDRK